MVVHFFLIHPVESFIENFITFQLLDSFTFHISTKVFYCRPISSLL